MHHRTGVGVEKWKWKMGSRKEGNNEIIMPPHAMASCGYGKRGKGWAPKVVSLSLIGALLVASVVLAVDCKALHFLNHEPASPHGVLVLVHDGLSGFSLPFEFPSNDLVSRLWPNCYRLCPMMSPSHHRPGEQMGPGQDLMVVFVELPTIA